MIRSKSLPRSLRQRRRYIRAKPVCIFPSRQLCHGIRVYNTLTSRSASPLQKSLAVLSLGVWLL